MVIKADPIELRSISRSLVQRHATTRGDSMLFKIFIYNKTGYCWYDARIEKLLNEQKIDFELVEEVAETDTELYFEIDGEPIKVDWLLNTMRYHKRESVLLNTHVDVYFRYGATTNESVAKIRFSDWNIFRTLSDDECLKMLERYIVANSKAS